MQRLFPFACAFAGLLVPFAAGCAGHYHPPEEHAENDEDDDRIVDEEEGDDDGDGAEGGFIDDALTRTEPLELGDATTVDGTGVTLRPPSGSRPMPFGAGFLAIRQRVQISVVVAEGGEEILEAIRSGGAESAPTPDHEEAITLEGLTGRLGRDRVNTQAGTLERTWLLVHDGHRALGVVATYEAHSAEGLRAGVLDVLRSVSWDRDAELDATRAMGIEIGPVAGLELSHRTTANVVLLVPGAPYPPDVGQVVVTVSPLPMQIPPDQASRVCPQLAARLVPAPAADVQHEGALEGGPLPGCERLATAETNDGQRLITYAAIVFSGPSPIMVTASADAAQARQWRERFASVARAVRVRE
jgi:hypothetical protein